MSTEFTRCTLGTLNHLGMNGQLVAIGVAVMRAHEKLVSKRCAMCKMRMRAMISGLPAPPRHVAGSGGDGHYELCDDCFMQATKNHVDPRPEPS